MSFPLFSRVILVEDLQDEDFVVGDMGTIVEQHPETDNYPEGYEVEFFAGNGDTLAIVSVPATYLREATRKDVMHVRQLAAA